MIRYGRFRAGLLCFALAAAGCGGGGTAAVRPPQSPSGAKTASVTLTIVIPQGTSSKQRRPAFLSPAVKSVSVTITGPAPGGSTSGPFVGNCSSGGFCSQTVDAPIGQDTFSVSLYDGLNATGKLLSSGSATVTISAAQTNTVTITFNPVVGAATATLASSVLVGTASSIPVALVAADPDGATIASPGNFETASGAPTTLSITLHDTTGHFSLQGPTSYTAPQTPGALTLNYDGSLLHFAYPTLTVSQDGTPIGTVQIVVLPSPVAPSVTITSAADFATSLAEGADGNVWFTARTLGNPPGSDAQVGKYAVSSATVTNYPLPNADSDPELATLAPDGAVWFYEQNRTRFAKITTGGSLSEFNASFTVTAMAQGPDGNLWFIANTTPVSVGKITPSGTITTYALPNGATPAALTAAAGRIWMIGAYDSFNLTAKLESIATDGTGYTSTTITLTNAPFQQGPVKMYTGRDGNFYISIASTYALTVFRITPAAVGTGLCSGSDHDGAAPSAQLDDGSIVFGAMSTLLPSSLLGVSVGGSCTTVRYPYMDPIQSTTLLSGAGDGYLYLYSTKSSGGMLTKYAY